MNKSEAEILRLKTSYRTYSLCMSVNMSQPRPHDDDSWTLIVNKKAFYNEIELIEFLDGYTMGYIIGLEKGKS